MSSAAADTKECPFCAETIKAKARVCRYCGRDLPPDHAVAEPPPPATVARTPVAPSQPALASGQILDLLTRLVEKNLISYEEDEAGQGRCRLTETVRQYAGDRLLESGQAERVQHRHRDWFLELAERAEPELRGARQLLWLNRLEEEQDNIRAALEWCQAEQSGVETGLRFAAALWRFWVMRARFGEGRHWAERALSRHGGAAASEALRARALLVDGTLGYWQGDYARSRSLVQDSLALARSAGDDWGAAFSLYRLGFYALDDRDYAQARALAKECLGLAQKVGDTWLMGHGLALLGQAAHAGGEFEQAMRLFTESLARYRETGDRWSCAMQLSHLAQVMRSQGNYPQARTLYKEGLRLSVELKDKRGTAWLLEGLAAIAAAQGRPEQAVRLMGASEASREVLGVAALGPLGPRDRSDHEQTVACARALLDASTFGALWSEGRAMTLEQAIRYALEEL